MTFNQIFDRNEDGYLEDDELLYWVSNIWVEIFEKKNCFTKFGQYFTILSKNFYEKISVEIIDLMFGT